MTHKHKGLSYTLKNWDSKGKASKALRMQVLRCVLAVGFALSPWLGGEAYAGTPEVPGPGIVRMDNTQYLNGTSTAEIYPEKVDTNNSVGLNRFTKFNVADGQIANLYFQDINNANPVQKLINTVNGRIDIQGTVNAMKNGSVGGDLYFISSGGMVVGANGVINAGNLTVLALPQSIINDINEVSLAKVREDYIDLAHYKVAENATIDIHGKIKASGYINLRAAYINITKEGANNSSTNASSSTMFNTTVNTTNISQQVGGAVSGTTLSATQDPETGTIVLSVPRLEADYVRLRDSKGINIQDAWIQTTGNEIGLQAIGDATYSDINSKYAGTITVSNSRISVNGGVNSGLSLEAGDSITINNNSSLSSEGAAQIDVRRDLGSNTFSGTITINQSSVTSNGMNIGAGSTINIGSGSNIDSTYNSMNVYTEMGDITNNGTIKTASQFNIEAGRAVNKASLTNSGTIQSTGEGISFTVDRLLTNNGTIEANGQITFTVGGTLTNEGKIKSTSSNVQAHIGRNFKNLAVPNDPSDISILTGGIIQAGGNVQIDYNLDTEHTGIGVATPEQGEASTIDGIYNDGLIKATGNKDPESEGGVVDKETGSGNIWLTSSYNITNYGTMEAGRQITLNARDFLHNYGLIEGVTYLDIKSIMGYVYNHASGVIRAKGGNIDLSSGQANLQIKDDNDGQKKELYRKFTPIIIEGKVEATSDDDKNNETREGNIKITAYLGDIYINGGTIETKPELGTNDEVKAVAGDVILDAAQNITIGFQTESARADDPTTDAKNDTEREYYKPLKDTSGNLVSGNASTISGSNVKLSAGSINNDNALIGGNLSLDPKTSVILEGSLKLQGNNMTVSGVQRSGNPTEPLKVEANGAGGTDSAINSLNLNIAGDVLFNTLNVNTAEVNVSGDLQIKQLHVADQAHFTSNNTVIGVYGEATEPRGDQSDALYRDMGNGSDSWMGINMKSDGYQITNGTEIENAFAGGNVDPVQMSSKLVDVDTQEPLVENYGDVTGNFGRFDLVDDSTRPSGGIESTDQGSQTVLRQDENGLHIETSDNKVDNGPQIDAGDNKVDNGPQIEAGDNQGDQGSQIEAGDDKGDQDSQIEASDDKGDQGSQIEAGDDKGDNGSKIEAGDDKEDEDSQIEAGDKKKDKSKRDKKDKREKKKKDK